jgi:methylated-DNA-[protein]-cysteine S-methyltransferase
MTPRPARSACVDTPPGPFTVVVGPDDAVLASGWTADVADLLPVVHRSLRPTWVEPVEHLPRSTRSPPSSPGT